MKKRILILASLGAVLFVLYGCSDTTDVPQDRINAEQKFRSQRAAGQPTSVAPPAGAATGTGK